MEHNTKTAYRATLQTKEAIVYANSPASARALGAQTLRCTINDLTSCRRAVWADPYAGQRIPAGIKIVRGMTGQCDYCGRELTHSRAEGILARIDGVHAFCNEFCNNRFDQFVREQRA